MGIPRGIGFRHLPGTLVFVVVVVVVVVVCVLVLFRVVLFCFV